MLLRPGKSICAEGQHHSPVQDRDNLTVGLTTRAQHSMWLPWEHNSGDAYERSPCSSAIKYTLLGNANIHLRVHLGGPILSIAERKVGTDKFPAPGRKKHQRINAARKKNELITDMEMS